MPPPQCLSRVPSRRNLAERQVDYPSRNAIFTYGELCAGLGLAADDRQCDRAVRGGDAGAADSADLLLAEAQRRPRAPPGRSSRRPAQMPVRPPPVVEAGDGLLADVAALGEADRAPRRCRPRRASSPCSSRRRSAGGRSSIAEDLGRRLVDLGGTGVEQHVAQAVRLGGGAIRSMPSLGADGDALDAATTAASLAWDGSDAVPATATAAGPIRERIARSGRRPRPRPHGRSCRSRGGGWSPPRSRGSVSIQISSGLRRRTRMSACMCPLRSSSAA